MNKILEMARYLRRKSMQYPRYGGVLVIFALALAYHFVVIPASDMGRSSNEEEKVESDEMDDFDLSGSRALKRYPDICAAMVPGEYYRAFIRAESNRDQMLRLYGISASGATQEIGSLQLLGGEQKFSEFVFQAKEYCKDMVVERVYESDGDTYAWNDGARARIFDVALSPVRVRNSAMAKALSPTLVGTFREQKWFIPPTVQSEGGDDRLSMKSGEIGGNIRLDASFVTGVWVHAKAIGSGHIGEYQATIEKYVEKKGYTDKKSVNSFNFSFEDMALFEEDENGWRKIPLQALLEEETEYFVSLRRMGEVKKDAHIRLLPLESKEGKGNIDSFLALETAVFSAERPDGITENVRLLSGAVIEDRADAYTYRYILRNDEVNALDVDDTSGKVEYDKKLGAVVVDAEEGAWYAYRFRVMYPLIRARIDAVQLGDREDELEMEYSLDGESWHTIPYRQEREGSQIFHGAFSVDAPDASEFFVRVRYIRDTKSNHEFGLRSLEVFAEMEK